ncbi:VOC family protein [Paracoccus sanguinis]|uniref:VOC family protein n=1 Tax=Paracoccus sanguinis TaxID=1545044 RepID=UPI0014522C3E|nr:VOC family protein [Paracoccus sanguinis]QJD16559.1 glyoxalase [Paracoccus sanguinis]
MTVMRIIPNLTAPDPAALARFWAEVLGLAPVMDHGWIVTLAGGTQSAQLSLAAEGGAGTPVPAVSIEVDDLDACHARALAAGGTVTHGPVAEDWGVRRFFLRDPAGNLVNLLSHR